MTGGGGSSVSEFRGINYVLLCLRRLSTTLVADDIYYVNDSIIRLAVSPMSRNFNEVVTWVETCSEMDEILRKSKFFEINEYWIQNGPRPTHAFCFPTISKITVFFLPTANRYAWYDPDAYWMSLVHRTHRWLSIARTTDRRIDRYAVRMPTVAVTVGVEKNVNSVFDVTVSGRARALFLKILPRSLVTSRDDDT